MTRTEDASQSSRLNPRSNLLYLYVDAGPSQRDRSASAPRRVSSRTPEHYAVAPRAEYRKYSMSDVYFAADAQLVHFERHPLPGAVRLDARVVRTRRIELPCLLALAESKGGEARQRGDCSREEARDKVVFWTRQRDAVVGAEAALKAALGDLSKLQMGQLKGIVLSRTGHLPRAKTGKGDALLAGATAAVSE